MKFLNYHIIQKLQNFSRNIWCARVKLAHEFEQFIHSFYEKAQNKDEKMMCAWYANKVCLCFKKYEHRCQINQCLIVHEKSQSHSR